MDDEDKPAGRSRLRAAVDPPSCRFSHTAAEDFQEEVLTQLRGLGVCIFLLSLSVLLLHFKGD